MAGDSSSSDSDVNFDTEIDEFEYFGDNGDNVQATEIVSVDARQPGWHHTGENRL